jgi:hypothetical protein
VQATAVAAVRTRSKPMTRDRRLRLMRGDTTRSARRFSTRRMIRAAAMMTA